MSAKQVEDSIKRLVDLGYSKSKAQKTLKECGNNFQQAKLCLERTKEAEARKQREEELAVKARATAEAAKKDAEERRKRSELEPSPNDGPVTGGRRHPCVAQYGSCRYGQNCMFRDLPWDTCINHIKGDCIYGDQCFNRHAVNGVDIRKIMNPHYDGAHYEYVPIGDGNMVQISRFGGKVQEGEMWVPEYQEEVVPAPLPEPSAFNPEDASMPTYTEPLYEQHPSAHGGQPLGPTDDIWGAGPGSFIPMASEDSGSGVVGFTLRPNAVTPLGSPNQAHPQPFLLKARAGQNVPTPVVKPITPQVAQPVTPPHGPAQMKHPCIVQMGECRFGDRCLHADIRGDVCVHWLNSRCRHSADTCRYHHEVIPFGKQPTMAKRREPTPGSGSVLPGSFGGSRSDVVSSPGAAGAGSSVPSFDPIWGGGVAAFGSGPSLGAASHHTGRGGGAGNRADDEAWTKAFDPPTREQSGRRAGEFLAAQLQRDAGSLGDGAAPPNACGKWRGPPSSLLAASSSNAAPPPQADSAEEARAFEALTEVFPHVDPLVLLQGLRRCGNDRQLVAQAIAESTPENVEKALQTAQEDSVGATKSLMLVTLHSLLPSMEPSSLEAILAACHGDFAEAYTTAAGTVEHLVASDPANRWGDKTTKDPTTGQQTSYTPADTMKLDRLSGMFRELDKFIIEKAFERANRNTTEAITILNHLNSDLKLVAHETREEWGRQATTKVLASPATPATPASAPGQAKPRGAKPAGVDSSSFTVTSSGGDGDDGAQPTLSKLELYKDTKTEAAEHADWRRTRQEAYMANTARAQMVGLAVQAYARGQHEVGKGLLRKAQELKRRYERLNMLAMHALERERSTQQGAVSAIDLHGFHVAEALDVVARRIDLCLRKRVSKLRVIIGHGNHSKTGKSVVYPQVLSQLKSHPACTVKSVLPAEIVVTVELPH